MEHEQVNGHVSKLPINAIPQTIRATPAVAATQDEVERKSVLIYIKLNYRTVPNQIMFIVSFHENHL
jgi:hypothetical protein